MSRGVGFCSRVVATCSSRATASRLTPRNPAKSIATRRLCPSDVQTGNPDITRQGGVMSEWPELLDIRWPQVEFEGGIIALEPDETKNREGRSVPILEDDMRELLLEAKREGRGLA